MQREIKFRAWGIGHSDLNHMHYAITTLNGDFITAIMQYVGIKDKNGTEIYEGDIVIINDLDFENDNDSTPWQIKYVDDTFTLFYSNSDYYYLNKNIDSIFRSLPNSWELEIIGNIYENPELLPSER